MSETATAANTTPDPRKATFREGFDATVRTLQEAALSTLGFFPRLAIVPFEAMIESALGGMAKVHIHLHEPNQVNKAVLKIEVTLGDEKETNPLQVFGQLMLAGARPIATLLRQQDAVAKLEKVGREISKGTMDSIETARKMVNDVTNGAVEIEIRQHLRDTLLNHEERKIADATTSKGRLARFMDAVRSYPLFSLAGLAGVGGLLWPRRGDGQAGFIKRSLQVVGLGSLAAAVVSLFSGERRLEARDEDLNEPDRLAKSVLGSLNNLEYLLSNSCAHLDKLKELSEKLEKPLMTQEQYDKIRRGSVEEATSAIAEIRATLQSKDFSLIVAARQQETVQPEKQVE